MTVDWRKKKIKPLENNDRTPDSVYDSYTH